jgi:hypothetical protein
MISMLVLLAGSRSVLKIQHHAPAREDLTREAADTAELADRSSPVTAHRVARWLARPRIDVTLFVTERIAETAPRTAGSRFVTPRAPDGGWSMRENRRRDPAEVFHRRRDATPRWRCARHHRCRKMVVSRRWSDPRVAYRVLPSAVGGSHCDRAGGFLPTRRRPA